MKARSVASIAILLTIAGCASVAVAQAASIDGDQLSWRAVAIGLLSIACTGLSAAVAWMYGQIISAHQRVATLELQIALHHPDVDGIQQIVHDALAPFMVRLDNIESMLIAHMQQHQQREGQQPQARARRSQ